MPRHVDRVLGLAGRGFVALGALIVAFAGFQLWGTSFAEERSQRELMEQFESLVTTAPVEGVSADELPGETKPTRDDETQPEPPVNPPVESMPDLDPVPGDVLGVLRIPAIDVEKAVVEGISLDHLRAGPGHFPGTVLPGHPGNVAIAGHRTTYGAPFGNIDLLVPGDRIEVETVQGAFSYEVIAQPEAGNRGHIIVAPDDTYVIQDYGDNRLTLTACHPKYSANKRIVVHAQLVGGTPRFGTAPTPASAGTDPDNADTDAPVATLPGEQFDEGNS